MNLRRVEYGELNGKQKEIYNFQKSAAILADYGFNCIKLADDWRGADFLAYHKDGTETLRVQLKARLTIKEEYRGRDLWMNFPVRKSGQIDAWYLIEHDELVRLVGETTPWLGSSSWTDKGMYSSANPSHALLERLANYRVSATGFSRLPPRSEAPASGANQQKCIAHAHRAIRPSSPDMPSQARDCAVTWHSTSQIRKEKR